jgi:heat-inducible transcriptional repressor
MGLSFNERMRQILFAIIDNYIMTANPVASNTISKKYNISLSSATIRSVMADLEKMGLLYHPHTSAGRIPTKDGFKYFAESLVQIKNISVRERELIEKRFLPDSQQGEDLIKEASKLLSNISNYAGLVLSPKKSKVQLKHINYIKLSDRKLLAVLVSKRGVVQNRIVEIDDDIDSSELEQINNYLNTMITNLTLEQVKEKILNEMKQEKTKYDKLLSKAIKIGYKTLDVPQEPDELIIEGEANLIDHPEFKDSKKIKNILKTLERKTMLMELLEGTLNAEGIQIFIGAEVIHPELKDLSIITSRFAGEDGVLGTIGVIGPTRMNYPKIIPLVDYTAKFLSKLFIED